MCWLYMSYAENKMHRWWDFHDFRHVRIFVKEKSIFFYIAASVVLIPVTLYSNLRFLGYKIKSGTLWKNLKSIQLIQRFWSIHTKKYLRGSYFFKICDLSEQLKLKSLLCLFLSQLYTSELQQLLHRTVFFLLLAPLSYSLSCQPFVGGTSSIAYLKYPQIQTQSLGLGTRHLQKWTGLVLDWKAYRLSSLMPKKRI